MAFAREPPRAMGSLGLPPAVKARASRLYAPLVLEEWSCR
ncbi:hypothetical protein K60_034810 [Mycobacterium tuberculosis variant bovis BCG str. Korea 1168P]|uniref:Uncharacterized protein n=1 Tax=Mycobacterium tuberculosis (strain CDC 1551 / Oshkosh) TaxID=83331 RepID=Q8VJ22_MYCTO|nr:hypothetical protein MT3449.1 [Mycobacterium tuberculosis CDC1551]AGE69391.1 hypothetical protein K60_034810 [Mycobacterium tuberculosis variant bovis BCG str. Korea 1168P]AGM01977.1 hypothetical protein CFBS_3544 [Mycobacterium tuberculosis CCDC5079]AHJ44187.1 hypothetical protein HKBS1_3541 [Mycobacterium tuberculosis HKBS1]AHJ48335.1 hypothetical protein HKBT2_3538 [Mycobacterium tuberculosis BT2]AHJ52477.1 hypothetical protein HKBT1_3531 [Mycobacterium tuberculosis BT1]AHJ56634.1 hypot